MQTLSDENSKMTFGKHKGKTLTQVMVIDPSYLLWAHENVDFFKLDDRLLKIAKIAATDRPRKSYQRRDSMSYQEDDTFFDSDVPF